eukprot:m.855090 g.855090  ORF g.855090 m.855090 type:complete len:348 (-) comp59623_c0_seq37:1775-2818(-)
MRILRPRCLRLSSALHRHPPQQPRPLITSNSSSISCREHNLILRLPACESANQANSSTTAGFHWCMKGEIGRGGFGDVKSANFNSQQVAIKLSQSNLCERDRNSFQMEVETLAKLSHENIMQVIGLFQSSLPGAVGYVCELADLGSLMSYLAKPDSPYSGAHILSFATDIAAGMSFLVKSGYIHRDLKSPNVLLFSTADLPRCKICDFGLVKFTDHTLRVTFAGTITWLAPEILTTNQVNQKTDVYSYGVLLWELVTRCVPYSGLSFGFLVYNVPTNSFRPKIPEWCPPFWRDLIVNSWVTDYKLRLSFDEILESLDDLQGHSQFDETTLAADQRRTKEIEQDEAGS